MKPILVLQMQRMGDLIMSFPLMGLLQKMHPERPMWTVAEPDFFQKLMDLAPSTTFFPPHAADKLKKVEFHSVINLSHRKESAKLAGMLQAEHYLGRRIKEQCDYIDDKWSLYRASIVHNNRYNLFHWSDLQLLNHVKINTRPYNYAKYNNKTKVGIFVGASEAEKRPTPQFFADLAKELFRKGYQPLFIGGAQDISLGDEAARLAGIKHASLCGKFSLNALAKFMLELRLFITPDTGPMHLASWLRTPILNISIGPVNPWETGPFFPDHYIIQPHISCCGCWQACTKTPCQQRLNAKQVAAVAKTIMEKPTQLARLELKHLNIYRTARDARNLYHLESINYTEPSPRQALGFFWKEWFWQNLAQNNDINQENIDILANYPYLIELLSQGIINLGYELQKHLKNVYKGKELVLEPRFWQKLPSPIRPLSGYAHLFLQNENYSRNAWDKLLQDIAKLSLLLK